jgi:hypothetical protein
MANLPQPQPPQPQQQAAPQSAEQHLIQAGAQPQHLAQARALGLSPDAVLGVLARLLPALLQALQDLRGQQGGGQATAAAP